MQQLLTSRLRFTSSWLRRGSVAIESVWSLVFMVLLLGAIAYLARVSYLDDTLYRVARTAARSLAVSPEADPCPSIRRELALAPDADCDARWTITTHVGISESSLPPTRDAIPGTQPGNIVLVTVRAPLPSWADAESAHPRPFLPSRHGHASGHRPLRASAMHARVLSLVGYARRGSSAIELALGSVLVLAVFVLVFDVYLRIKGTGAVARIATVVGESVALDPAPTLARLGELARHLHVHEVRSPSDLVLVITVLGVNPGSMPATRAPVWTISSVRSGDPLRMNAIAASCSRVVDAAGEVRLGSPFRDASASSQPLVVVETCARLRREGSLTGRFLSPVIYRLSSIPVRDPRGDPARACLMPTGT